MTLRSASRRSLLAGSVAGAAGLAALATARPAGAVPVTPAAAGQATGQGVTDWINVVTQYGADPTGVADSTSAIKSALAVCPPGGVVYFPAGTYTVSSPLLIAGPGTRLQGSHSDNDGFEGGASNAAIINAATGFSGDAIIDSNGQADFSVRDLNVHGHNMPSGTTLGINVNGGGLLENVLVGYTVGTGIKIRNGVAVLRQVGVFHAGNATGAGSGFVIDGVTGNGCIQLNGCEFRRDGNNNAAGGGGHSGIAITGTTAPVIIDGSTVTARQGDNGGTDAPVYGLTMATSAFVSVNGGYLSSAVGGRPVNWDGHGALRVTPGLLTAAVSGSSPALPRARGS